MPDEPETWDRGDDKFIWNDGDLEITDSDWMLSYEDNGATILVQDANGLMQHFMQQPDFDDDLQGTLERFLRMPVARFMPENILRELEVWGVLR